VTHIMSDVTLGLDQHDPSPLVSVITVLIIMSPLSLT